MAIAHAIRFLKQIDLQKELRDELYLCKGLDAIFLCLKSAGFPFTGGEFEEAVDVAHCACKTHEEADVLMSRVNWMRLLMANA